jgi:hypothetical protein
MENDHIIQVKVEPHFAGHYRIEYDGKYVTLFGWDKTYPVPNFYGGGNTNEYEEMVLISCVAEVRKATPCILNVNDEVITIDLVVPNPEFKND